jgi:ERF superfamily
MTDASVVTDAETVDPVQRPPVLSMPVPVTPMRGAGVLSLIERYVRDPSIDVVKLEGMVALQERLMRWEAETAWNTAMAEAQAEMRAVSKDSSNPQTHSRYASYAAIDAVLRPIYSKLGFALSFNTEESRHENWVKIVCEVSKGGHSRRYQIDMPADGKGARGNEVMTRTHAAGSAVTYGMRYLATMIFNLAMTDDDGNGAGRSGPPPARRPPPPRPNVMLSHDPETGEIMDQQPTLDPVMRWDEALGEAAEKGTIALSFAWTQVPAHLKPTLAAAKDRRHKVRAAEVDAAASKLS